MERLLLIETSTALCSTALAEGGRIVCHRESDTPRAHASMTAVFVQEMLQERGLRVQDCDAVCVGMGPGSYTGLRVGVSTAKGLCFGAQVPLVAVGTLDTLAAQARDEGLVPEGCVRIVPLVDARRMEVYTAVYSPAGERLTEVEAQIIDAESFAAERALGPVLFVGDGAAKCADVLGGPDAHFAQCFPKAAGMLRPALDRFHEKRFEDVAYFEPFYLKQFMTTTSRKRLF